MKSQSQLAPVATEQAEDAAATCRRESRCGAYDPLADPWRYPLKELQTDLELGLQVSDAVSVVFNGSESTSFFGQYYSIDVICHVTQN